jgi:hypothetical protein
MRYLLAWQLCFLFIAQHNGFFLVY